MGSVVRVAEGTGRPQTKNIGKYPIKQLTFVNTFNQKNLINSQNLEGAYFSLRGVLSIPGTYP